MILTLVESKCYPLNHLKNHITRPNIMALLTLTGKTFFIILSTIIYTILLLSKTIKFLTIKYKLF